MSKENTTHDISEKKLRDLLRQSMDENSQKFATSDPSFQVLWSRARQIYIERIQKTNQNNLPSIWLRRAVMPTFVLATIALVFYFNKQNTTSLTNDQLPTMTARLQLPTDGLLAASQYSYLTAKIEFRAPKLNLNLNRIEFPTDSLKWRPQ